ncbi:hypothetical protein RHECNPAF_4460023 [Rhizobium etli CNPAF512]|nr:hypothetical protein RHECNPAF_4460023 [Rhizobium etli CNPAF512]
MTSAIAVPRINFFIVLPPQTVPGCTLLTPEPQAFALKPQFAAPPLPRRPVKRNKQTVKFVLRNIHSIFLQRRQVSFAARKRWACCDGGASKAFRCIVKGGGNIHLSEAEGTRTVAGALGSLNAAPII